MRTGRMERVAVLACIVMASACQSGDGIASSIATTTPPTQASPPASAPAEPSFADPIDVAIDGRGTVWVANYANSTLLGFLPRDLHGLAGRASAAPSIVLSGFGGPNQIQFDRDGNLWVAAWDADRIDGFAPESLVASGDPRPIVSIRGPAIRSPTDLVFDDRGDLWVANQDTGTVLRYARDDLRKGGRPRPQVVLQVFPVGTPQAIAFAGGRLWVSTYDDDAIAILDPSQIRTSGSPRPADRLTLPTLSGPIGLTFDGERMWVSEATADAVAVFPADARGDAPPATTLQAGACVMPHTVTFDPDGNAWVPCYNDRVLRFAIDGPGRSLEHPSLVLS